ncbi:uncharacterized protein J8A68_005361 [[Candida] subhashii]|uniref:Alpha-1,2-mannosyltransferase n=1 Tax=[Candida] subhashii TaxID=561895 RepID=A0A8J5Q3E1_9ASCO|nr:uncharacterized protein J8A68_005361 [[Candida] subhashii]KAG7661124.1 hypothetical protein J8A68_005361 [[Candida] subhashii]
MFNSRRFSYPSIILAIVIGLIVVFNVHFIVYGNISGESNTQASLQDEVSRVGSEEYRASMINELEQSNKEELLNELKKKIEDTEKPRLIQELRDQIAATHEDAIKEALRKQVAKDYTSKYFKEQVFSYKLFEDLASDYAQKHVKEFKDFDLLDAFKGMSFPDISLPHDFNKKLESHMSKYLDRQKYFTHVLKDILIANKPKCEPITKEEGGRINPTYQWDCRKLSEKDLRDSGLNLSDEKFEALQDSHDKLVKALKVLPDPLLHFINGDGIVINGGGGMIGGALVALVNLRELGSTLPVEIILDKSTEYDSEVCDELLPNTLNAKCVVVEREVGKDVLERVTDKFARKVLGILVSSFDNIIALDADNLAIKNVDSLFHTEPFLSTKMLLWPDIWHKTTSPIYYDIARFEKGEPIRRHGLGNDHSFTEYISKDRFSEIHYHDLSGIPKSVSTETGQIVMSKRKHFRSLLLSLYYSLNQKDFYKSLLYQGAPGSGDRETFLPALHVMNEDYFLEHQSIFRIGYDFKDLNNKKHSEETTLGQTDPRENYEFYKQWREFLQSKDLDTRLNPFQVGGYTANLRKEFIESMKKTIKTEPIDGEEQEEHVVEYELPSILFLHCHHPKIDPIKNAAEKGEWGTYSKRNIGHPEKHEDLFRGIDWELKFHTIAKWVACEGLQSDNFWKNIAKVDRSETCERVSKFVDFLMKDTKDPDSSVLKIFKDTERRI